jgi:hypothetical protein
MASHQTKIQHLFLRAGFGETPDIIQNLVKKDLKNIVNDLFDSSKNYKPLNYLPYPLNEKEQKKGAGAGKQIKLFFKSVAEMEQLNEQWIFKMTYTKAVLREKMTFFWHNHFATSMQIAYLMQVQNNTLRANALGSFKTMLHAISKDPAMIIYLNNQQNVKDHPNENFAREVMELFTLGEGNYTEKDIKEAARAFTGWTTNKMGDFEFVDKKHDFGEKEFMGKKGNFNGEEIIDILLENPQTAKYITTKLYKEFVNAKVDKVRVHKLSTEFFESGYDIEKLMRAIFSAEWFYDDENIGCKICSPVELIVRYKKYLEIEFLELKYLVNFQKGLGQVLFFPPNVAGWKGDTHWIDSTSLLLRLNTISYINEDGLSLDIHGKPAFEAELEDKPTSKGKKKLSAVWEPFLKSLKDKSDDELIEIFIQSSRTSINKDLLTGLSPKAKIIQILTFPEFQLI